MLSFSNVLHQKVKKNKKKDKRAFFWGSPRGLDLFLTPQSPNDVYSCSFGVLSFQIFFNHFLLLLEKRRNLIKFCTKFCVKEAKFLPCKFIEIKYMYCRKCIVSAIAGITLPFCFYDIFCLHFVVEYCVSTNLFTQISFAFKGCCQFPFKWFAQAYVYDRPTYVYY